MIQRQASIKIIISVVFFTLVHFLQAQPGGAMKLWYTEPANASIPDVTNQWKDDPEWLKALPLCNGSLGAMVFGDVRANSTQ